MEDNINKKWNTESFYNKVKEIDSSYELSSEYISNRSKIKMFHTVCNKYFYVTPSNFIRGIGWCSHCAKLKRISKITKSDSTFKQELNSLVGDEYISIDKYVGANTKIKFKHKCCDTIFSMTPSNFLQGQRCPICFSAESHRHTPSEVQEIIYKKLDKTYLLVSDYKNNHTQILVKHLICNNIWKTTLRGINSGNRCPFCTIMSKGEEKIYNTLRELNYDAIFQYTDDRCKNKNPLPFDFYIPSKNIFIEYDGVFHYEAIYGDDALRRQKENDKIKDQFIIENNLTLIRIPYWEFDNIDKILKNSI